MHRIRFSLINGLLQLERLKAGLAGRARFIGAKV
jgi:hypothetical protein